MSQAPARAWWEDVEHLREAAERRIAERERAQRDGRERPVLTPLRPRGAETSGTSGPTGRFRRGAGGAPSGAGRGDRPRGTAIAQARAATAEATARVLAPAEPEIELDHWSELEPELDITAVP